MNGKILPFISDNDNKGPKVKSRGWLITDYSLKLRDKIYAEIDKGYILYTTGQEELCPSNERRHHHYFIYCEKNPCRQHLKELFGYMDIHYLKVSKIKGAIEYCQDPSKKAKGSIEDVGPWEKGIRPGQGKSRDLKKEFNESDGIDEFMENLEGKDWVNAMKSRKNYQEAFLDKKPDQLEKINFYTIKCSNIDKAMDLIYEHEGYKSVLEESIYPKSNDDEYFDRFQNEKNIVIKFYEGGIPIQILIGWTSKGKKLLRVRGGSQYMKDTTKNIWIISDKDPKEWYEGQNIKPSTLKILLNNITKPFDLDDPSEEESNNLFIENNKKEEITKKEENIKKKEQDRIKRANERFEAQLLPVISGISTEGFPYIHIDKEIKGDIKRENDIMEEQRKNMEKKEKMIKEVKELEEAELQKIMVKEDCMKGDNHHADLTEENEEF